MTEDKIEAVSRPRSVECLRLKLIMAPGSVENAQRGDGTLVMALNDYRRSIPELSGRCAGFCDPFPPLAPA